jgi:ABC-type dipeptide/oligopeptide/nickel transport system ATPase component
VPSLVDLGPECRFYSRCERRSDACRVPIAMRGAGAGREVRCVLVEPAQ